MSIDILAALADEAPPRSSGKCKIQRWIDTIDAETPGLTDLLSTINTTDPRGEHYRTQDQTLRIVRRLGLDTSMKTLADHRAHRCKCFD